MRAEGHISVKTKHLINSANAAIDCQNTSFDLGSTNGTLQVQNLTKDQVERWAGGLSAWSGVWTNLLGVLSTNVVEDPPGSGTLTNQIVTNVITIGFHALFVDGGMNTRQDAFVRNFALNATNAVVSDSLVVLDGLRLNTHRLTLNTNALVALNGNALDWNGSSAPTVQYFTNHGYLFVQRDAFFGVDRPAPYSTWINHGVVDSYTTRVRATELDHRGTISASGGMIMFQADSLKVDGGQMSAWGDAFLFGRDLKFRNMVGQSWTLLFNPTNSMSDSGWDANNRWSVFNGFELGRRPATGDLLGTRIESTAPQWAETIHRWAGEDRGPVVEGYQNNAALGYLDLSAGFASALTFTGTSVNNALYVDFLELNGSALTDPLNTLIIDSNMVLYFADSNVPVEQLDGLFADDLKPEGRLRWVSSFAGPNSSVDVLLSDGRVIRVNRALRESLLIDSDGDGIPNGLDDAPFDNLVLTRVEVLNDPVPGTVAISWKAAAGASYTVEFVQGMSEGAWRPLTVKVNPAAAPGILTVLDTSAIDSPVHRFYRVRLNP